jgi:hypothetical protein
MADGFKRHIISTNKIKVMTNIVELLECIKDDNFQGMLKYFPEGIIHRASKYDTPDSFELEGTYEEDARYGWPAREKMKELCLEYCINELKK